MSKHKSKLENVATHLVAVLFTLSSLFAVFLSLSVTQPTNSPYRLAQPAQAVTTHWIQNSWGGGTSNSPYTIAWNTTGGWTNYASASGLTPNASGFTLGTGGYLVSSVFHTGSKRVIPYPILVNSSMDPDLWPITTYFRFGNSEAEVNAAAWWLEGQNLCSHSNYTYFQYKIENTPGPDFPVTDVYTISNIVELEGTVKDTNNSGISAATLTFSTGETTTTSSVGSYFFEIDAVPAATINVTASKSGFNPQTKDLTFPPDGCATSPTLLNFNLTSSASASSSTPPPTGTSGTQSSSSTATTQTTTQVSLAEFQNTKLPAVFTASGSTTTDLAKVVDLTKIDNFTLDIPGKNKIVFTEPIDLSIKSNLDLISKLDNYVSIGSPGTIGIDSKTLAALNKPATITVYNLPYVSVPEILIDGQPDTKGVISGVQFDKSSGSLTFDVAHFSVFSVVPKLELFLPKNLESKKSAITLRGRISDPKAKISGKLNEVKLAITNIDPKTGEFSIDKIKLKEGANILLIEAKSDLGKVLPINTTLTYDPVSKNVIKGGKSLDQKWLLTLLLLALAFLVVLGWILYRKRQHTTNSDKTTVL